MSLNDEFPEGPDSPQMLAVMFSLAVLLLIAVLISICACSTKINSTIGNENIEAGFNIGISTRQD